jgi:hypothetical protein
MITIKNLTVSPFVDGVSKANTFFHLSWELEVNNDDLTKWELRVLRSNSPEGPFDSISLPIFNDVQYIDYTVSPLSKNRVQYYKVRGTHVDTGHQVEVGPERLDEFRDLIGLEIIRRNNLLLKRFVGVPVGIFIRRTSGQRCNVCFDHVTRRPKKDNCKDCYGTAFDGGFYDQITTLVNFNPEPKVVQLAGLIESQDGDTNCWMSNYPTLSPGDIIAEASNKRWRVIDVSATRKFRYIIHQIANLRRVNPSDGEYMIPFDNPSGIISDADKAKRREHTVVALSRYQPDENVSVVI